MTVVLLLLLSGFVVWQLVLALEALAPLPIAIWAFALALVVALWLGFFVVQPNHGQVLQLFGRYVGTAKEPGLWWARLRARPDVLGSEIALLGHSEGGAIAPLVAKDDSTLAGIVLLAGPGKAGRAILTDQFRRRRRSGQAATGM